MQTSTTKFISCDTSADDAGCFAADGRGKKRHKQVLAQLQEVPPRQSDRLKIKPKKDYKKFDKFGY